jgi:formate-dependent nitrite reductase membrane component NrfD
MEHERGQQSLVDMARRRRPREEGRVGTAHTNARDAYKDVPLLVRPTWNHEVAAYFYFAGVSSGAFIVGTIADLFGGGAVARVAGRARLVAFAAMLACPPLLIDDLGVPSRFHHMLRIFKPSSPMNLGAWTLTAHGAFATLLALRQLAMHGKVPLFGPVFRLLPERPLAAAGLLPALTLGGYTGVLLGTTSIPVWSSSPVLGALFMASSLSTGTAAVSLTEAARGGDADTIDALAPLNVAFGVADLAALGSYVASSGVARKTLLRGKTRLLIAGAAAATTAGVALEAAALVGVGNRRLQGGIAAAATLVGGALLRWGVVGAGHDSADDRETTLAAMSPSASAPGWGEPPE